MAEQENDDNGQKTEDPSEHRLEQAFEKGQVALSREINHWFMLGAATLIILFVLPASFSYFMDLFIPFIAIPHLLIQDYTPYNKIWQQIVVKGGIALLLPLGVLTLAALASGFIQTRLAIAWDALVPKGERISPFKGFKRVYSLKATVEFIKNLIKVFVISLVVYEIIRWRVKDFLGWINIPTFNFLTLSRNLIVLVLCVILSILFLIAGLDFLYQKFEFLKKLRMTPDEIKKEHKQLEGDPVIKQRLRRLRENLLQQSMIAAVPKATAIVTNPTHYSVAIEYEQDTMKAPKVIAKGKDAFALKIREIALKNKIPIFEDPPLARALYATIKIDQEIDPQHYQAVARIIQLVMKMKKQYF